MKPRYIHLAQMRSSSFGMNLARTTTMMFTDGIMNGCGCSKILADKMTPSQQKLARREIIQRDSDPKRSAKVIQEFLKKKKLRTMTWLGMSPELSSIKQLRAF
uniref:Uncharacterized protein n=1 Tax=Amphiprion percula TaxID=161767 RepID=A0A3P8TCL6_AMPPE